jgi:hypothetical protein
LFREGIVTANAGRCKGENWRELGRGRFAIETNAHLVAEFVNGG